MPTNMRLKALIVLCAALAAPLCEAARKPKTQPAPPPVAGARRAGARHHRRRHHRVPPGQRPARAAVPRPVQADHHGQHHLPGRLAPRELRRDRHGAPARAPGVQGHAAATRHPEGAHRARRAPQRHHLVATAPTTSRPSPPPTRTCAGRSISRPTAWSIPSSRKKDLDSEMTVVRNEFEMRREQPDRRAVQAHAVASPIDWHNYGKRRSARARDIENVPIERLQAFYRTYYQPDNAVLLVAGKFDEAATLELVQRVLRRRSRSPTRALPRLHTVEPTQDGERQVTLRRVGDVQVAAVAYHVPAGSHADFAALSDCSAQMLGDAPSGRLHKALVETSKAASVFGAQLAAARSRASSCFAAQVRDGPVARRRRCDAADRRSSRSLRPSPSPTRRWSARARSSSSRSSST